MLRSLARVTKVTARPSWMAPGARELPSACAKRDNPQGFWWTAKDMSRDGRRGHADVSSGITMWPRPSVAHALEFSP